jgi:hypothetical protein
VIRYRWTCTCGSTSRKAFDDHWRAEHERWRHETQRCGKQYTSTVTEEPAS